MRRNAGGWTGEKVARKIGSHALYIVASLLIAHIFLSYFASLPKTFHMVRQSPTAHPEAFTWVVAMTAAFYLNFAWFREQLCVVICPYGRLSRHCSTSTRWSWATMLAAGNRAGRRARPASATASIASAASWSARPASTSGTAFKWSASRARSASMRATKSWTAWASRHLIRYDSPDRLHANLDASSALGAALQRLDGSRRAVAFGATRRRSDFEVTLLRLPGEPYTLEEREVRTRCGSTSSTSGPRLKWTTSKCGRRRDDGGAAHADPSGESASDARCGSFLVPRNRFQSGFLVHVRVAHAADARDAQVVAGAFLGPSR